MRNSFIGSIPKNGLLLALALLLFAGAEAKAQVCPLNLQDPAGGFPSPPVQPLQDSVKVAFTLPAPCAAFGKVKVQVTAPIGAQTSGFIDELSSASHDYKLTINLYRGRNTVTVIGFDATNGNNPEPAATWTIDCAGQWCNAPFSLTSASVSGKVGAPEV